MMAIEIIVNRMSQALWRLADQKIRALEPRLGPVSVFAMPPG